MCFRGTGGILTNMKNGDPHYTRMVLVIGVMLLALVVVSVHHLGTQGAGQEAAVLRAYGG